MSMQFRIEALDQHYGSSQVLRQVGLEIAPGECLAVLGRNGAGKTTLLKCVMGLIAPSAGRVLLDGADITGWSPNRRSRAGIAYVPQGREIFSELTVGENIEAAARAHGTYGTAAMAEAVSLFPVLAEMWRRPGGALSGGQQQQLAIARALVTRPRLLILDEPTEGIQPNIVAAIGPLIRQPSYEVGPDFIETLTGLDAGNARFLVPAARPDHALFDLPGYIAARLTALGVGTIDDLGLDTYADEARFFSYRRATHRGEPDYGRLIAAITLV
ncbi:MAG: ATP-binding cassette domain-containing protein [Starkeya sp.]|nr:ATP-binding cassette domain-containing protein [Starkeya sp.]